MRKFLLAAAVLGAVVLATTTIADASRQQVDPAPQLPAVPIPGAPVPLPPLPTGSLPAPQYVLKVGDTMRVEGGSLGCQVTRRGGRPVIECRPAGALRGRYGTLLSDRTATVARFRSKRTAQVVFTARHRAGWRACGKPSRAARAAAGGCR